MFRNFVSNLSAGGSLLGEADTGELSVTGAGGVTLSAPDVTGEGVRVLVHNDLVAGGGAETGGDGGPRKEELPETVKVIAVLVGHLLAVGEPVEVPAMEGVGVVTTDGLDGVNFHASELALLDVPVEGSGGVSAGEDVLGHEETPVDVFPVGALTETGDLHQELTVFLEAVADLLEVDLEVGEADVFSHLDGRDSIKALIFILIRDITVIAHKHLGLLLGEAFGFVLVAAPLTAFDGERDGSSFSSVLASSMAGESSPSTADVEELLSLLDVQLVTDHIHLVVLCLLESFVQVLENGGRVDHAGAKEGCEEIVTAIVMLGDFLFGGLLVFEGGRGLGEELLVQELNKDPGETEVAEFVTVLLEEFKEVALELDLAVAEGLPQDTDGDLVALPRGLEISVGPFQILVRIARLLSMEDKIPVRPASTKKNGHKREVTVQREPRREESNCGHDAQLKIHKHHRGISPTSGHRPPNINLF